MQHAEMPIMEEVLSAPLKARPASGLYLVPNVELAAASGFSEDEEEGEEEEEEEEEESEEEEEEDQSEEGDAASYGSSSPCSSCPSGSPPDGSVRSPFSSHDTLSCTLHHGHVCSVHCSHEGSFGFTDGSYLCSSSSHACAYHKNTTSSCQTVGYASLGCHSVLCDDHGSSIHASDEGSFDDGYVCSTSPCAYADVKQAASSCQTAALGCHSGLHLSSEREKSMEHPSSCGFNDGDGCSTSFYYNSDESCVISSCRVAGGNTTYCHCGLCQNSEGETDMKQPAPLRFSDDCTCADEGHSASSCHVASCSSTSCYDGECHGSEEGTCNTFLSFEEGYGNSALNHFAQNGLGVVSMHNKEITLCNGTDSNDKSGVGHGSLSHSSLLPCSDEANPIEPHIQGTSIRGKFIAQDPGGSRCGPKEGLGSRSRRVRELGRMFQLAVDQLDWRVAEDLIPLADKQRLNDCLCIAVDSFWFICTHKELCSATQIMEKLVKAGADGFTRAALRTSFLASCVWACQSRTRDLSDTVNVLADRLHERLQECSGYEMSSAEAVAKVKRMAEWGLKRIGFHCQAEMRGYDGEVCPSTPLGAQLQLRAFKRFLELAGNRLSGEDYTEAFEAACFPLSLFSIVLDSGWASGIAAIAMQGLLGMLVEGGADNVNQCCLEAARSGSTELLQMLLQIAQRNGIEVDVDVALGYASHHCKLGTMECLVDVGNAAAFLGPLFRAADRGCMPVVKWFVEKGCLDTELCLGLMAAVSSNRVEVIEYFMKCIPLPVLGALGLDIIIAAAERSGGCLKGIIFLLQHDFLGSPEATYEVADRISKLEDGSVSYELKFFCKHEWSNEALIWGRKAGEDHYLNVLRVLHHGSSPLQLKELPPQLQVAIAYLPLYKECAACCGLLLSQQLRGQLIEAALRLDEDKCYSAERLMTIDKYELVALLKARLPTFFVEKY